MQTVQSIHVYLGITSIGELVSILWIYIIITKSSQMPIYKWFLLKLAVCELVFYFSISWIAMPDVLMPDLPIVVILGPVSMFGEYGGLFVIAFIACIGGLVFTTLNECCFLRIAMTAQLDVFMESFFSRKAMWKLIMTNILGTVFTFTLASFFIDHGEAFENWITKTIPPRSLPFFYNNLTEFVTVGVIPDSSQAYLVGIFSFISLSLAISLNFAMSLSVRFILQNRRLQFSTGTYMQHSQICKMLICQTAFPVIALFFPVALTSLTTIKQVKMFGSDITMMIALLLFFCYPIFSACSSLYFVRQYRLGVIHLFSSCILSSGTISPPKKTCWFIGFSGSSLKSSITV